MCRLQVPSVDESQPVVAKRSSSLCTLGTEFSNFTVGNSEEELLTDTSEDELNPKAIKMIRTSTRDHQIQQIDTSLVPRSDPHKIKSPTVVPSSPKTAESSGQPGMEPKMPPSKNLSAPAEDLKKLEDENRQLRAEAKAQIYKKNPLSELMSKHPAKLSS